MRWLRAVGGLAVLYVVCLALGGLAGFLMGGLLDSAAGPAALASLVMLVVGVAVVVVVARGRAVQWTSNPYW